VDCRARSSSLLHISPSSLFLSSSVHTFSLPMSAASGPTPTHPENLHVTARTWTRDSHDLFDFGSVQLQTQDFTISGSSVCVRDDMNIRIIDGPSEPSTRLCEPLNRLAPKVAVEGEPLLQFASTAEGFWVDQAKAPSTNVSKKLWLVLRCLPEAYQLSEGDVMKLGRVKIRVRQLVRESTDPKPELKFDDTSIDADKKLPTECPFSCRICFMDTYSEDNPLITPCKCRGSIQFVHLACLRSWIRGRMNIPSSSEGSNFSTRSFFYKPLPCELCKAVYPTYICFGQKREPLVQASWIEPPYIVLENLVREQDAARGLYVIALKDRPISLGRGHGSDVRFLDVPVSRCHATIRFQNDQFLLEDNNSKFGTFIAMKKPKLVEPGCPISVQTGRTVFDLNFQAKIGKVPASPRDVETTNNDVAEELTGPRPTSSACDGSSEVGGVETRPPSSSISGATRGRSDALSVGSLETRRTTLL